MSHADTYKEIFDVVSDARDPAGVDPSAVGVAPGYDLTKTAAGKPMIWCVIGNTPMPMTWEVYAFPGEPMWIQALCPQCVASHPASDVGQYGLTIKQDAKPFEYDPRGEPPPFPGWSRSEMAKIQRTGLPPGPGGRLTIEPPIECTRCGWKARIVDNVVWRAR